jgi:hypothetical protein
LSPQKIDQLRRAKAAIGTGKGPRGKRQPKIGEMTKKPKPTPKLTTGKDLRDVNDDMFDAITELYEPKTKPRIEKP